MPILLVILAVVVLALPWALCLLDVPIWVPLALDLLGLMGIATALAVRWAITARRAQKIERALAKPVEVADPLRADRAAEVDDLRRDLEAAIATLKRSRLEGGGRRALHALPWFVVVGAPNAGKSTLLRTSGLSFPNLAAGSGAPRAQPAVPKVRASAARRVELCMTNQAVLVDAAGSWCVEAEGVVWAALVEQLTRHRGRRAVDGVVLTLGVDELLDANEAARRATVKRLRARLDELVSALGLGLPITVVVTKCDRLPGFRETFASLSRAERAAPWGFTLPLAAHDPALVEAKLGELAKSLRARVPNGVADERRPEARGLVAEHPGHFALLHEPLAACLSELFAPNVFDETPLLRGVYFTSATQDADVIDRLVARSLPSVTTPPRPSAGEPQSYFVHDVLTKIVFADARRAAPTHRTALRRALVEGTIGVVLAGLASVLAIAAAFSWSQNRALVDTTRELASDTPRPLATVASPTTLEPLRARVALLRAYASDGPPLSMRFGLFPGTRLSSHAETRYAVALRDAVLAPLLRSEANELAIWGATFETELDHEPSTGEHVRALALIERQLRFTAPRLPSEPALDLGGQARVAAALAHAWCESLGVAEAACSEHARLFVTLAQSDDSLRCARDDRAVRLGRLGLSRVPSGRTALAELVSTADEHGYDLTLGRMVGTTGRALVASRHVRGAFTRRGWNEVVRTRIDGMVRELSASDWLYGTRAEGDAVERGRRAQDELRAAYFAAYVDEWQGFLASVRVAPARDPGEALALLEDLTRGTPPPLGRLLVAVGDNLVLSDAAPPSDPDTARELVDAIRSRVSGNGQLDATRPRRGPASIVETTLAAYTHFAVRDAESPEDAPLGVDVYREELTLLRDALASYQDDPSTSAALETRVSAARRRVDGLVAEQPLGARAFFEAVLRPPIEVASTTSSVAMASAVAASFCASVTSPFATTLAGHYPFSADGSDAALADFAAFYRPSTGTAWSFYDASLASIAPRTGSRFAVERRLARGGRSPYGAQLPLFLERTSAITSAFFAPGQSEPRVELDLRVHPTTGAASVRFSVGGTTIDYRNGPETWSRIAWPGPTPDAGASLEVLNARGMQERVRETGEWGLFRLIESATEIEAGAGDRTRTLSWHLPGHDVDVSIDVRSVRAESPFFGGDRRSRVLGPLRGSGVAAPRRIARETTECAP